MSAIHERGKGNKYRYDQGCRCEECRHAKMSERRRARDRARAANSPAYQRELATSRRMKERYHGACERCGAATSYSGHGSTPSRYCAACAAIVYPPIHRARTLGKGPMIERLLNFLTEPHRFTEIAEHLGISHGYISAMTNRHLKSGLIVRPKRGVYLRNDRP